MRLEPDGDAGTEVAVERLYREVVAAQHLERRHDHVGEGRDALGDDVERGDQQRDHQHEYPDQEEDAHDERQIRKAEAGKESALSRHAALRQVDHQQHRQDNEERRQQRFHHGGDVARQQQRREADVVRHEKADGAARRLFRQRRDSILVRALVERPEEHPHQQEALQPVVDAEFPRVGRLIDERPQHGEGDDYQQHVDDVGHQLELVVQVHLQVALDRALEDLRIVEWMHRSPAGKGRARRD